MQSVLWTNKQISLLSSDFRSNSAVKHRSLCSFVLHFEHTLTTAAAAEANSIDVDIHEIGLNELMIFLSLAIEVYSRRVHEIPTPNALKTGSFTSRTATVACSPVVRLRNITPAMTSVDWTNTTKMSD